MSDRIDYTTDGPDVAGAGTLHSTRQHGDVLSGGNPGAAPDHLVEDFEPKSGLVGASPDGDPDSVENYESGQDDGQMV